MNKKILLSLLMLVPLGVQAQVLDDNRGLFDKVERLERDVILMQRRLYKNVKPSDEAEAGEDAPKANTEHLYARIAESEKVAQESTAQIEEVTFKINQLSEKVEALSKEMAVRFEQMEQKIQESRKAAPVSQPEKAVSAPRSEEALPEVQPEKVEKTADEKPPASTAKEAYQAAYQVLKKGDYPAAEMALKQFLADYPDDALAGNAQYWLGETYYVQGVYDQAAVCFAEGFKKYKDGPKGADTLLKLGMTMEKLDKKAEACTAFKNIEKSFPKASDSVHQKAKSEIEKLSCS